MIKIITKEEYEFLQGVIKTQKEQIEELIRMVKEAHAISEYTERCYLELLDIVDETFVDLPTELREEINRAKSILNNEET